MTPRPFQLAAAALAGAYFAYLAAGGSGPAGVVVKTASTLALAAAAAVARRPGSGRLSVAMLAHSAGDALIEVAPLPAAMGAFLVGHLLYLSLFLRWRRPLAQVPAGRRALAAGLCAIALALVVVVVPRAGALAAPVAVYAAALLAMALSATVARAPTRVAAGAASYVVSDALLAIGIFVRPLPLGWMLTWPTYWGGQAAITAGVLRRSDDAAATASAAA